jgi:hypothetical protein
LVSPSRPAFLDADLVAENSRGAPPVGAVRKDRTVWRILQFGIPDDQQSGEAFRTREDAGARLLELAGTNRGGPAKPSR